MSLAAFSNQKVIIFQLHISNCILFDTWIHDFITRGRDTYLTILDVNDVAKRKSYKVICSIETSSEYWRKWMCSPETVLSRWIYNRKDLSLVAVGLNIGWMDSAFFFCNKLKSNTQTDRRKHCFNRMQLYSFSKCEKRPRQA